MQDGIAPAGDRRHLMRMVITAILASLATFVVLKIAGFVLEFLSPAETEDPF